MSYLILLKTNRIKNRHLFSLIEMLCGDPTTNLTALKQAYNSGAPSTFDYQTSTVIRCASGYKWAASETESIVCGVNGVWNFSISCSSMTANLFNI